MPTTSEKVNEQVNQQQNNGLTLEFKRMETRFVGPFNITVRPNEQTKNLPKEIDIVMPPISFLVEPRFFLPTKKEENLENQENPWKEGLLNINSDLNYELYPSAQGIKMTIKFSEPYQN